MADFGTVGGAQSPWWGGNVKLYVWAAIYSGTTMLWGQSATDNLDSGNVFGGGPTIPPPPAGRMWIDLSCDVLSLETNIGGRRSDGAIAQSEAGTCTIRIADPTRKYDPTNPQSPFQYGGQTRLSPGTRILVWAELLESTVTKYDIFTGTVDTWSEDWALHPANRAAAVIASDATKDLVNLDYGEQPEIGTGDTVTQRVERILTHYGYAGARSIASSTRTLQSTSLAQSAWELLRRTTEDEIGFMFLDRSGVLTMVNREMWVTRPAPVLTVGCAPGLTAYDVILDADVQAASLDIRNGVYASVVGGTQQIARNEASISRYGLHSYKRTDLGLQTDGQAGAWATFLVALQSVPRAQLQSVELGPRFDPAVWSALLGLRLVVDRMRVVWAPPGTATPTDSVGRVLGLAHEVTRKRWNTTVSLALADLYANVMHWGTHAYDKLNVGNVYV